MILGRDNNILDFISHLFSSSLFNEFFAIINKLHLITVTTNLVILEILI